MKTPCEVMIWYILPWIRRELTNSMIDDLGLTQVAVAKKLGITEAAVSQYRSKKRGKVNITDKKIQDEIILSAKQIVESEDQIMIKEMCRICSLVRVSDLLPKLYQEHTGAPMPACLMDSK